MWTRKFFLKNLTKYYIFCLFACFTIQNKFKNTEKESEKKNYLNPATNLGQRQGLGEGWRIDTRVTQLGIWIPVRRYFITIINTTFHCDFCLILSLVQVGFFSLNVYNIFGLNCQTSVTSQKSEGLWCFENCQILSILWVFQSYRPTVHV